MQGEQGQAPGGERARPVVSSRLARSAGSSDGTSTCSRQDTDMIDQDDGGP